MLSFQEVEEFINKVKSKADNEDIVNSIYNLKSFFQHKFSEVQEIFKQIDNKGILDLFNEFKVDIYSDKSLIFSKGEPCSHYYFLMFGDITIYSEEIGNSIAKLLKTISGGTIFGHKVKDIFNYYAYANSSQVMVLSISKEIFNRLMDELKDRAVEKKQILLKKYIPGLRTKTEDIYSNMKDRFMKLEYPQGSKILVDGEYEEYVFLVISGECSAIKSIKKIKNLKELASDKIKENITHIVIEIYSKFLFNIHYRKRRYIWSLFSFEKHEIKYDC